MGIPVTEGFHDAFHHMLPIPTVFWPTAYNKYTQYNFLCQAEVEMEWPLSCNNGIVILLLLPFFVNLSLMSAGELRK